MDTLDSSSVSEQSGDSSSRSVKEEHSSTQFETFEKDLNLTPFKLKWSFGINPLVPLLNLTTDKRTLIAYGCSHAVVLYDYKSKDMFLLQGHQNAVGALSTDSEGKWLLSADFEEDSVVIIWDTEIRVPICTLFKPHGKVGMTAAQISPDAKYVVTIGNEIYQKVHLWLWTYGKDEPDASLELKDTSKERVKQITFNAEYPDQIVLTMERNVVFVTWKNNALESHKPKIIGKLRNIGIFNGSTYLSKTHQVLTATSNGFVLIWSDVHYRECFSVKQKTSNIKFHVKTINLQTGSITVILDYEGMVVTGNSAGHICFYDNQLKLLYWCQRFGLDSIVSISFDIPSNQRRPDPIHSDSEFIENSGESSDVEEEEIGEERKEEVYENEKTVFDEITKRIPSNVTITLDLVPKPLIGEDIIVPYGEITEMDPPRLLSDATIQRAVFLTRNFIVLTTSSSVARIDISKLKCHYILHKSEATMTALDAHPDRDYMVTGNANGLICLYKYSIQSLMVARKTPPVPEFLSIIHDEITREEMAYVTCPQTHASLKGITALKYAPNGTILACGMESGAMWILHPDTLEPFHEIPFKHSSTAILSIVFSQGSDYMAYYDDMLTVAVFRNNESTKSYAEITENTATWQFLGKYHSHRLSIREVLFGSPAAGQTTPRLFSLGEDRDLIEYDLKNSGPYPDPGLKILNVDRIEYSATPLSLAWYPQFGVETFLVTSNSEYKFKLLNDVTRMTRGTILGPTFGAPVQQMKILPMRNPMNRAYMIFATEKQIGLQLLPFDGNPFKMLGIVGHPKKITQMSVSGDGKTLFTLGYNDPCVLMWNVNVRAVDVMARLGGESLSPFYCLIDGGQRGWLLNEMQDLFQYAQILHQGENTTATRIVSDKVSTTQIPNLMRAMGFYPSNYELEDLMSEVSYRNYAETGQQVEEITFEEFVKLYINYRPAFGVSLSQLEQAFLIFCQPGKDNPTLSREEFLEILLARGEPLTRKEAHKFLSLLVPHEEDRLGEDDNEITIGTVPDPKFDFLPLDISYKDFAMDIMGIGPPEELNAEVTHEEDGSME